MAASWLHGYLARGSRRVEDVKRDGETEGYSFGTLKRVKTCLGIETIRRGSDYHWHDPDSGRPETESSESVAAAIREISRELTRLIRMLARQQQQPEAVAVMVPEASTHITMEEASAYALANFKASCWDDAELEAAAVGSIIDRLFELRADRKAYERDHGRVVDGKPIDKSAAINALDREIERLQQAAETKMTREADP